MEELCFAIYNIIIKEDDDERKKNIYIYIVNIYLIKFVVNGVTLKLHGFKLFAFPHASKDHKVRLKSDSFDL